MRGVDVQGPPPLSTDRPLFAAAFTHPQVAVATGVDGGLYRSQDGGVSWARIPGTAGVPFWDVAGLGGHTVMAVGDGVLWRSEDAGRIWSHATPPSSCSVRWVRFTGDAGLAGCEDGEVLVSEDGGRTWAVGAELDGPIRAAVWMGTGRALALDADGHHLRLTDDGGYSWWSEPLPAPAVELVPGADGVTLLTSDGRVLTTGGWDTTHASLEWRVLDAAVSRDARTHRVLPDGRVLFADGARVWVAAGAERLAVARVPDPHAMVLTGDGGVLVLQAGATTRLEPR